MQRLYREYCSRKINRWGNMVPINHLPDLIPGYAGLYAYSKDDAGIIRGNRSSRGLDRFVPWADRLTIDVDDSREHMKHNLKILLEAGYGVDLYKSGGVESYHLEVMHRDGWVGHPHLPYSHRQLVTSLGLQCDLCIYQHGRIFRMKGMVHEKTGNRKTLVKSFPGSPIEVPIVAKPSRSYTFVTNDSDDLGLVLMDIATRASVQPEPGDRHMLLWGIACDLFRMGLDFGSVDDFCQRVNDTWKHAKTAEEVTHAVRGAYIKEKGGVN